jgi:cobalt/nickel transport system ATP-binding protein
MEHIIKVDCLKHVYPDKTEVSACGLAFTVHRGERVTILGPNGAGKTTLLNHIIGLLKPIDGEVSVLGMSPFENFNELRKHMGVVFQNVDEQIIGPTVYDDIAFTPRSEGLKKPDVDKLVKDIAKEFDILHLLDKIPHYLSGGQKKKVALAGALVMKPEFLILDEPFDSLDTKSKKEIIDILNRINKELNTTLITTTHDINIVPSISDVIYVLNDGKIITKGNPHHVFSQLEILKEASLEKPILSELFYQLKELGYIVDIPFTIKDAKEKIIQLIEKGPNN